MTVSTEDRLARAALSFIAEPGDALLTRIVAACGPSGALEVIKCGRAPDGIARDPRERERLAVHLSGWRTRLPRADPEGDLTICAKLGGRMICPGEAEWPTRLADLGEKEPLALWLRGPSDLRFTCLRSVAVVGSRAASPYGTRVAQDLGAELAERGWTVVSGGALGVDAAAHRGALAADGDTVGVFANGVDVAYPPRNDGLIAEMARRALLVSEWPLGTSPTQLRFLVRNRVIAALSCGTVVVEADLRSGSLNTAEHARRLGRPLMAVPGPINSRQSRGANQLLRADEPAICVTGVTEVIEAVGRLGTDLAVRPRGPVLPRDELDAVTRRVLEAIPARGGAGPAQVAVRAGVDVPTVLGRLGLLSAGGFIERGRDGWRLPRHRKGRAA